MRSHDARIVRSAAIPTLIAGVLAMVISLVAAGSHGLIGAALGVALVVIFFAAGQWAISWAAENIPQFLMPAALGTYLVQILLVAIATGLLSGVHIFTPRAFGFTALACTLVWMGGQIRALVKTKMFYVQPDADSPATAPSKNTGKSTRNAKDKEPAA